MVEGHPVVWVKNKPDSYWMATTRTASFGVDQGGVWGYGETQHDDPTDTGDADEQDPADAPTGSFWTFDDAENP